MGDSGTSCFLSEPDFPPVYLVYLLLNPSREVELRPAQTSRCYGSTGAGCDGMFHIGGLKLVVVAAATLVALSWLWWQVHTGGLSSCSLERTSLLSSGLFAASPVSDPLGKVGRPGSPLCLSPDCSGGLAGYGVKHHTACGSNWLWLCPIVPSVLFHTFPPCLCMWWGGRGLCWRCSSGPWGWMFLHSGCNLCVL